MSLLVVLDTIPSAIQLSHVQQNLEPPASQTINIQPNQLQSSEHAPISLGGRMPPVPAKLVNESKKAALSRWQSSHQIYYEMPACQMTPIRAPRPSPTQSEVL